MLKQTRSCAGPPRAALSQASASPRLSPLVAVVLLVFELFALPASAHELEVDTLSIQLETESGKIVGQFLLDPDMTRPDGAQTELTGAAKDKERDRLLSFIRDHVALQAGDHKLELSLELRELYVKGGAVPGDSVMYSSQLPNNWRRLTLQVDEPFDQLAVMTTVDNVEKPTILISADKPLVVHKGETRRAALGGPTTDTQAPVETGRPTLRQAIDHVGTGFLHIVPLGWDHILFVVALTLGSLGQHRRLILELSAFTVAHTITLGLGALRIVAVPASIIEPLIAFSIAAVAVEHLVGTENARLRFALVGGFGLLHGLGFAGALLNLGFTGGSFLLFLGSFNIGVELGQLLVVVICLAMFRALSHWPQALKPTLRVLAVAICVCGLGVGLARLVGPGGVLSSQKALVSSLQFSTNSSVPTKFVETHSKFSPRVTDLNVPAQPGVQSEKTINTKSFEHGVVGDRWVAIGMLFR